MLHRPLIDAAKAAGATVEHQPLDIVFDHALRLVSCNLDNSAFILCGRDISALNRFVKTLGLVLKQAGIRSQLSRKLQVMMLDDSRTVEDRAIKPVYWTAS